MKLLSCFLLFLFIEMYHTRRISTSKNTIRIPLRKNHSTSNKLNAANPNSTIIPLDVKMSSTYGNISIGTEPQNFSVLFDTGSPEFWVYSSSFKFVRGSRKHRIYNHTASSTYRNFSNTKHSASIRYRTGEVSGFLSFDTVSMAGIQIGKEFIEVTQADEFILGLFNEDGIMGLQYNRNSGNIVSKICNKVGGANQFSYYLPRSLSNSHEGELILCGEDKSKYKAGTMNFVKEMNPFGQWIILVESIQLKHDERILKLTTQTKAIVDTGTNRISGPKKIIEKLLELIKARPIENFENENQVECNTLHLLPKMTFSINRKDHALEGEDYIRKVSFNNKIICQLLINPTELTFWILGDVFIQKFYTVFDIKNHRIGFAENNQ